MVNPEPWKALMERVSALLDAGAGQEAFRAAEAGSREAAAQGDLGAATRLQVLACYGARACDDRDAATAALQAARALAERCHGPERDDIGLAVATASARLDWAAGQTVEGLAHLEMAWQQHQAGAQEITLQQARVIFGALNGTLCRTEDARRWFQAVHDGAVASGDEEGECLALVNLSACAVEQADLVSRQRGASAARPLFEQAEPPLREAWASIAGRDNVGQKLCVLVNLGHALVALGRWDEAEACLDEAGALSDAANHQDSLWTLWLFQRARLRAAQGRDDEAWALVRQLLERAEQTGESPVRADLHALAAELAERRGDAAAVLAHLKRHLAADKARTTAEAEVRVRLQTLRDSLDRAESEAERLRHDALRDPLTGLANRRALDEALVQRRGRAQCVVMIDVDHFKQVNDQHSHAVGDAVLRQLGQLLGRQCRADDLAVRHGGEEFVLLLDGVSLHEAQAVCERLRAAAAGHDWALLAPGLTVTVSIGLATLDADADAHLALAAADAALYAAKRAGRNRVVATPG